MREGHIEYSRDMRVNGNSPSSHHPNPIKIDRSYPTTSDMTSNKLLLVYRFINSPVVRTPAKTQHYDTSMIERNMTTIKRYQLYNVCKLFDCLVRTWPYFTGLRVKRYSSRILTLPVHADGAVPSSYLPLQFPCSIPSSSSEFT